MGVALGAKQVVIGGDQPFVRRLIGVSTSPLVGSIYNMGVWDKVAVAVAWVNVETRRNLDHEEAARRRYKKTGPPTGPQETKVFFRVVRRKRRRGDPPAKKAETPPPPRHHHHRTAY